MDDTTTGNAPSRIQHDAMTEVDLDYLRNLHVQIPELIDAKARITIQQAFAALPRLVQEIEGLRAVVECAADPIDEDTDLLEDRKAYREKAEELYELLQEARVYVERVAAPYLVLPPESEWEAAQLLREINGARLAEA